MLNLSLESPLIGNYLGLRKTAWNVLPVPHTFSRVSNPLQIKTDILEDQNCVTLSADVPGIKPKDLHVTIEPGQLTIRGTRIYRHREKNPHKCMEWASGSFLRTFYLPDGLEVDKAKASSRNGVLTVTIPRSDEAKPRKITVNGYCQTPKTVKWQPTGARATIKVWWNKMTAKLASLFGRK
ncbi:Hsp20/alpha crystallin family protein [Magnetococcales bacterium HHB-1]